MLRWRVVQPIGDLAELGAQTRHGDGGAGHIGRRRFEQHHRRTLAQCLRGEFRAMARGATQSHKAHAGSRLTAIERKPFDDDIMRRALGIKTLQ